MGENTDEIRLAKDWLKLDGEYTELIILVSLLCMFEIFNNKMLKIKHISQKNQRNTDPMSEAMADKDLYSLAPLTSLHAGALHL